MFGPGWLQDEDEKENLRDVFENVHEKALSHFLREELGGIFGDDTLKNLLTMQCSDTRPQVS